MKKANFNTKEALKLYVVDELTTKQVADRVGVSSATMTIFLREKGVVRKPGGQAMFDEEKIEEIVKRYKESGKSCSTIALEYGCSSAVIHRILRDKGVKYNRPKCAVRIFTPEEKALAFKMRKDGVCITKIQKALHTGSTPIKILLGEAERGKIETHSYTPKGPNLKLRRFSQKQEKQILKEYESGVNLLELSKRWNMCHSLTRNIIRRNGGEIRRKYGIKKGIVVKNHLNYTGFRTPRGKEIEKK